jgi:transglutaminase-like putative cysteine protease
MFAQRRRGRQCPRAARQFVGDRPVDYAKERRSVVAEELVMQYFARLVMAVGFWGAALLFSTDVSIAAAPTPKGKATVATTVVPLDVEFGPAIATRYRVGATFTARGGTVENIRAMVAVPLECPEQEVEILEEDISPEVDGVEYRQTDEGVRQMLIHIPVLAPRQEAHATVTYEVRTAPILRPVDVSTLRAPLKPDRTVKRYLGRSPFIDVNHRKIRAAVKEALAALDKSQDDASSDAEDAPLAGTPAIELAVAKPGDAKSAEASATAAATATASEASADWRRVEALYDYAIDHVKYEEGADKSSVQVLEDGRGDCQAIAALFVALCRTEKIPARMVWVDGHQYAEFYLENETGAGRWFPVESAGRRAFGEMPVARVILQKGDNFRVPERPRDRLRYASDYALFLSKPDRQPKIAYIREQL